MKIKVVTEKEFSEWLQMRYELWPEDTIEELENEMKEIYKEIDKKPVYIAIDKEVICGFIELSIHTKAPGCQTSKIGFIEGWYVKSNYRKKGIGKMLVHAGEEWARSIGCLEMASDTTKQYPISPLAHIALGYEEVDIPLHYRKVLK